MKKIFMFIGCLSLSLCANDLKKGNEIDLSQFQDKTIEKQTVREKYELIDRTLNSPKNVLTVSYICEKEQNIEICLSLT